MIKFGNKTFCSRTDTSNVQLITALAIDHDSLLRMNLCLLRQLGLRNQKHSSYIIVRDLPKQVSNELYNCDFIDFLKLYSIKRKEFECILLKNNGIKSQFQFNVNLLFIHLLFLLLFVVQKLFNFCNFLIIIKCLCFGFTK